MGRVIVFVFLFSFLLIGCSTKQAAVLPQVSNHTETKTELVNIHDTLMQKDSVIIIQRGDTIYHIEKHMIYNPVVRYIERTDTVVNKDTVSVPVYVEKGSESISIWDKFKIYVIGVILGIILIEAINWYLKFKK